MIMLRTGDWVLVADSEEAYFLENAGDTITPDLVRKRHERPLETAGRASDRAGRRIDNAMGQRSALEQTDLHQVARDRFAEQVADMLGEHARAGDFTRLVLFAAPAVLGKIRTHLDDATRACVIAEVPKTLTNHPLPEIGKLVLRELAEA